MHPRLSTEEYNDRIEKLFPNVICLDDYVNNHTKLTHRCSIHGLFCKEPMKLLNRQSGCPKCGHLRRGQSIKKTEEYVIKKIFEIHGNSIKLCEPYRAMRFKHKFECVKGHEWLSTVDGIIQGNGCKTCGFIKTGLALIKSQEKAIEELKVVHKELVKLNEPYKKVTDVHKFICDKGHTWKTSFGNVLYRNSRCPYCCNRSTSNSEKEWITWMKNKVNSNILTKHDENITIKLPKFKRIFHPDGYDPVTKTVYEFYGDYWHGNLLKRQTTHFGATAEDLNRKTRKREKALLRAGYKVVYCWESDFKTYLKGKFHFRPKPYKIAKLTKSPYCR